MKLSRPIITVLLAVLLSGGRVQAATGPEASAGLPSIDVRDGRISADVDAPLGKVLAAIARAGRFEIRVHGAAGERTRLVCHGLPVEVALRRLLGRGSSAFVYALPPSQPNSLPVLSAVHVYLPGSAVPGTTRTTEGTAAGTGVTAPGIKDHDPARVLLESESWVARKKAVQELATTPGDGAVDALERAVVADEDPWVREKAVRALGGTRNEKAVASLSDALLGDEDPFVREAAATSLGKSRSEAAVGPLASALREDPGIEVREAAAAALGKTPTDAAMALLADVAERDESDRVRARAQAVLRSIRGDDDAPVAGAPD